MSTKFAWEVNWGFSVGLITRPEHEIIIITTGKWLWKRRCTIWWTTKLGADFNFYFTDLLTKNDFLPDHLKQLALEVINNIPKTDIKIYTDGSKIENTMGSGIYIETPQCKFSLFQYNLNFCSVFRSELLAIDVGFAAVSGENNHGDIWIVTDNCRALHLQN